MKCDCKKSYSNYANIFSNITAPVNVNTNEFFPFTETDSKDWKIDYADRSVLICKNPGVWMFTVQFQVVGTVPQSSFTDVPFIDGWFVINGVPVYNTDATASGALGVLNVLTIAHAYKYEKGDILQIGIRSSSTATPPVLGVQCIANTNSGTTNVNAPSIILTGVKVN